MTKRGFSDPVRAGVFVLMGVVAFTLVIFLLGQKSALFTRTADLYVSFPDVNGLVVGAPVRLAGLEVGTVAALSLPKDLEHKGTKVRLVVQQKYLARIRADSLAYVETSGLLGDKIVNISIGDPSARALEDGATLQAGSKASLDAMSMNADQVIRSMANVVQALDEILRDDRTERLRTDVPRIANSLANILGEVEHGAGLAHRILYDPVYAREAEQILVDTRTFAARSNRAVERVDAILAEIERGDGAMHELVYGQDAKTALSALAAAGTEVSGLVRDVRDREGALHALIYEQDGGRFVTELNEMAVALNALTQDVEKGRGTIGGLLRDPTVYEDLKTTLGNVKRNVLLKALVRFATEQDGLRRVEE